jgi:hypothetical protein
MRQTPRLHPAGLARGQVDRQRRQLQDSVDDSEGDALGAQQQEKRRPPGVDQHDDQRCGQSGQDAAGEAPT